MIRSMDHDGLRTTSDSVRGDDHETGSEDHR